MEYTRIRGVEEIRWRYTRIRGDTDFGIKVTGKYYIQVQGILEYLKRELGEYGSFRWLGFKFGILKERIGRIWIV